MHEHEENPMSSNFTTTNDYGSTAALLQTPRIDNHSRSSSFSLETATPASTLERKAASKTFERNSFPTSIKTTTTTTTTTTLTRSSSVLSPQAKRRLFPKMSESRPGSPSRFAKMSMDERMAVSASAPGHMLPNSETHQIMERIEFLLNIINQMCVGFVTIYMSWLCLHNRLAGTALHAWLVTLGFTFLMAEAVMCHYNGNLLTHHLKRNTKTTIHWVLQVLGGGLGIAGILIKCIQKNFQLTSLHGKLGFSAFILCLVSLTSGLGALYSVRIRKLIAPLFMKSFHNLLGLATFVIAMVTQFYGYSSGFFMRKTETDFQNLMKVLTLIILVLTSIGPLKALYHKFIHLRRHFK